MVLPRTGRWTNFRAEALGTENGPLLTSTMAVLLRREAARRSGALGCFIRAFTTNRARARRVLGGARHHCSLVCRPEVRRYDRATTTLNNTPTRPPSLLVRPWHCSHTPRGETSSSRDRVRTHRFTDSQIHVTRPWHTRVRARGAPAWHASRWPLRELAWLPHPGRCPRGRAVSARH